MDTVKTLKEAEKWFLSHSSGNVKCVRKIGDITSEDVVSCYPDAQKFYEGEGNTESVFPIEAELICPKGHDYKVTIAEPRFGVHAIVIIQTCSRCGMIVSNAV